MDNFVQNFMQHQTVAGLCVSFVQTCSWSSSPLLGFRADFGLASCQHWVWRSRWRGNVFIIIRRLPSPSLARSRGLRAMSKGRPGVWRAASGTLGRQHIKKRGPASARCRSQSSQRTTTRINSLVEPLLHKSPWPTTETPLPTAAAYVTPISTR